MSWLRRFGHFWWDFVIGDDWRLAAAAAVALGLTALFSHHGVAAAWIITPIVVVATLAFTLSRALPRRPS
jgi:hypothetical protein